jgi:epoxyqueuosine reductase
VGVARSRNLEGVVRLNEWLDSGYAGTMDYMSRHADKRLDPAKLHAGTRSIIVVFQNYYQATTEQTEPLEGVVSRYAWGRDYHLALKERLHDLARRLHGELSKRDQKQTYRVFVDSAPVMEKVWAQLAGLGWQGKHTNLITRELGSWGFLGVILTTAEFDRYDEPGTDHCGSCSACIDACPTAAIVKPYVLDGGKCISYGTIELKPEEPIPEEISHGSGEWLFGCDICQDVCPWNRFAKEHESGDYVLLEIFKDGPEVLIQSGSDEQLKDSPLSRPGIAGLRRNLQASRSSNK